MELPNVAYFWSRDAGSRLRAGVLFLLYRKILQTTSLRDETVGKVCQLCLIDRLEDRCV